MSRPHDEGHRANDAPQVQTQNQQPHFANDGDAGKALATMKAKLALLGIEARHLHADAWALIASTGATIGIVKGAEALAAAAAGFEAVQADVLRVLQQIATRGVQ